MKKIFRAIISVSLVVISLLGAVFLVWPKYREYSFVKTQVEMTRDRLESGERVLAQLKKTQEKIDEHEKDFAKINEAIPQDAGLPVLYDHISQLAVSSGLVLLSIEGEAAQAPDAENEVIVLVFKAELAGSYEGLKNFLDEAKRSARIFNVSTLDIAADGENPGQLNIEIELFAYETP